MQAQAKEKIIRFEDGKMYFSRRTERTFFFVLSLIAMSVLGLTKLGVF